MIRLLVIEDGLEYSETLGRFLGETLALTRAGSGVQALALLEREGFDAVFLDMRFDRAPEGELVGDLGALTDRHNGDPVAARRFLEDHQGTYVLAALREAGCALPVLFAHDFSAEPARLARLATRYGPLRDLVDGAGPQAVLSCLRELLGGA